MDASEREPKAGRSWFVPVCAAGATVLLVLHASCLNPMPEEYPSDRGSTSASTQPPPAPGDGAAGAAGIPQTEANGGETAGDGLAQGEDPTIPPSPTSPAPTPAPEEPPRDAPDAGVDAGVPTGSSLEDPSP